jgi:hypothetical protein
VTVVNIEVSRTSDARNAENVATTVAARVPVAIDNHQQGCFGRPELRSVDAIDQGVRDVWEVRRATEQVSKLPHECGRSAKRLGIAWCYLVEKSPNIFPRCVANSVEKSVLDASGPIRLRTLGDRGRVP